MKPRVVVVGLGPAGPELLTAATLAAIERVPTRFVRTERHPSASAMGEASSFDRHYESAATLDHVYTSIVEELVAAAQSHGEVLYAVPGAPCVAERTVELLAQDSRVEIEILPAVSFADLAWARLGVDPLTAGVRLVDGRRFATEAAGERGPLLVAQCDSRDVLSEIKLAVDGGGDEVPEGVVVLERLGLPDESVTTVAWDDLDRTVVPDHLTSLYIPHLAAPVGSEIARFVELVRELRERCPWDREQTHASLSRHLLEEAYEVLEAIDHLDADADGQDGGYEHLEEELGDLLFQVVFHANLAAEAGRFTLADVARNVHDKLVGRHPHVFGDAVAASAGDVVANWERSKMTEKGRASIMEGIPAALPALLLAHKVARKAASAGVGVSEEDGADDVGATLFAVVERARLAGVDPEAALRATVGKFRDRFMATEAIATSRGLVLDDLGADTVQRLWEEAGLNKQRDHDLR